MSYIPTFEIDNLGIANLPTPAALKTNTRTSTATAFDHEGVLITGLPNEIMLDGGRRVETLSSTLTTHGVTVEVGRTYQVSCEGANASTVILSGAATRTLTNNGADRQAFDTAKTATTTTLTLTISGTLTHVQVEDVTGSSNDAPSAKIDASTDYGYGVDGVQWHDTENGNSVSGNVVTEAAGAAISPAPQVQMLPARVNEVWPSRDFTHANWVASNITPLLDATGLDGTSNAASTLTATAANGTIFNTITLTSLERTTSFHVKRKTGTGVIEFTDDGGSTYTAIEGLINSSTFTRVDVTTTQANPSIGFRIVASGDEIIVDAAQTEAGKEPTTPIETTTVGVTRAIDEIKIAVFDEWFDTEEGVLFFAFTPGDDWAVSGANNYVAGGWTTLLVYRNNANDGLTVYDGANASSIYAGNTPGSEILAATIWSAVLNKLVIGYSQDGGTTWDWDPTPTAFSGFTPDTWLRIVASNPYTMRGLTINSGLPPGYDATLTEVQDWVESISATWPVFATGTDPYIGSIRPGSIALGSIKLGSFNLGSFTTG